MVDQMSMQEILDAASDESFVSQMIDANPWHKSYAVRVTKFIHALYDSVPEGWEPQGNTSWRLRRCPFCHRTWTASCARTTLPRQPPLRWTICRRT